MSLWPRSPYVQLWLQEKQHDQNMAKNNGIDDLQHFQEPNVWVNGLSWPQDSRSVMFVEGIQWASLEIWGHCASDFEECLVTAYNIHQRVSWFYLLLFYWYLCKIISLVWVTGWKYSEFRPHDPNINFWDREFPSYCWDKTTIYIL